MSSSLATQPQTTSSELAPIQIKEELQAFIDPARILIRPIDRIAFASDASVYRLIPRAVVQPVNAEEVRKLFRYSRQEGFRLPSAAVEPAFPAKPLPMGFSSM